MITLTVDLQDDLNQIKMTCSNCSVITMYPNITLKESAKGIDAAFYSDTVNTAIKAAKYYICAH
jgi:hypothetical protein